MKNMVVDEAERQIDDETGEQDDEIGREDDETEEGFGVKSNLTAKQEQALLAVLSHRTLKDAARAAGVSETTLWRYMRDEAFSEALQNARRVAFRQTLVHCQTAADEAVAVLREVMSDRDAPASSRVAASRASLDYYIRAGHVEELQTRVEQLVEHIRVKQEQDELDAALRREEEG